MAMIFYDFFNNNIVRGSEFYSKTKITALEVASLDLALDHPGVLEGFKDLLEGKILLDLLGLLLLDAWLLLRLLVHGKIRKVLL